MRNQKGITLIALIITIIVMLILVAVTISVALNGGIFNNASDAKTKTQKAVSKEELISTMVGAYDSTGSFDKDLVGTLPSGAKWCKENETYANATNDPDECDWIITEIGNKFYIDSSGSVLDEKPEINVSPVTGIYSVYIVSNNPVTSITLDNDMTGSATAGGNSLTITEYTYDSTASTITVTIGGNPTTFNYIAVNGNKIMTLIGGGTCVVLTTNGGTGITPISANTIYSGTISEKNTTFEFKTDGTFTKTVFGEEPIDLKYCIINNEMIWIEEGQIISLSVDSNYEHLGTGNNVLDKQS